MPFPLVLGLPSNTPKLVLDDLRAEIIATVAREMGVKPSIVRPFCLPDLAGDPSEGQDTTIYVRLDTGLYHGKPGTEDKKLKLTTAVAQVVWETFLGRYEVEVFIGDLDLEGRTLLHPKK